MAPYIERNGSRKAVGVGNETCSQQEAAQISKFWVFNFNPLGTSLKQ